MFYRNFFFSDVEIYEHRVVPLLTMVGHYTQVLAKILGNFQYGIFTDLTTGSFCHLALNPVNIHQRCSSKASKI